MFPKQNMEKDFLTLQEAADRLGKSTQTIRRMIKREELKAQRIKTPQGFHYVIKKEELEGQVEVLDNSPIQNGVIEHKEEEKQVLINQNEIPTNQNQEVLYEKPQNAPIDKNDEILKEVGLRHYKERMALIHILEKLQAELDKERKKPRTLLGALVDWVQGH